jgi:UDP-2,3-diacylglucosamine pyrophosphatase LpxH
MKGIFCSDVHARNDKPRCRLDENWLESFRKVIIEIVNKCNKYKVPLFIIGDIFDTPNVPAIVIVMLIEELSKVENGVYFLSGNHDLPQHSYEKVSESSIGIFCSLAKEHSTIHHGMSDFGMWADFNCEFVGNKKSKILFMHQLVFKSTKSIPPNCKGLTAPEVCNNFSEYKWIFTGDNHKAFHYENENGQHLINPGCIIKESADEINYEPSIYYVDTDNEIVKRIKLESDNSELITDEYIKIENERDERINSFVENIKKDKNISLSIIDNIRKAIIINKDLKKEVILEIEELIEEVS